MCESDTSCVYRTIVEKFERPIILFRSETSNDFENFKCLHHNKAFFDLIHSKNLTGMPLLECFETLPHETNIAESLTKLLSKQVNVVKAEGIVFGGKYIPKNTYTLIFDLIDDSTFSLCVENVSEQIKAKLLADEIAETKEQFVANVSHEIRTPLNGILGYIAMMSDPKELSTLSDYQRTIFEQIHDCSMNLLYIMNDILDFSKLNADQMQLKDDPFDIAECIEKSYDVIKPSAHEKKLEVAFYVHPNVPPRIKGDFKKLRQILLNLLSNGIKFTSKGRIDTTVKLINDSITNSELDVEGKYTIEFTVEDTGIGINTKNQSKLFKSFSQIDQSNHKIYQGTGLGLIITKKLIELMGGSIRVKSVEGEGTKFIFTIKVEEARAISSDESDALLPLLKDKSVLVVDDHVTNRVTIASSLVKWGMKPYICSSAEEALLYLRGGIMHFDFALIDMRMPKMDGNELADKIFAIEPTLPLIAISSIILTSSAINKNFSFCISKPIKQRQLFNICVATIRKISLMSNSLPQLATPVIPTHFQRTAKKASKPLVDPEIATTPTITYPVPICKDHDRSILIAEDLRTNQRVIQGFLEKLGFQNITIVEDGKETLEAVGKKHFDIIMMDLKMPHIDGFEATKRIRKFYQQMRKNEKNPFIIALTANAIGNVRDKCVSAGMDAYICKPIHMQELAKILNESASR